MGLLERLRPFVLPTLVALVLACILLGLIAPAFYGGLAVTGPLLLLGIYDRFQRTLSLLCNYPVLGCMRSLLENDTGPVLLDSWDEASAKSFADG